jgi:hypothetical protein
MRYLSAIVFSSLAFPVKRVLFALHEYFEFTSMTRLKHFVEAEISASAATVIGSSRTS